MTEKRLLLAAHPGLCAGVERAVTIVERALARYGAPIYVRRHIVHNLTVVDRLQRLGAVFVQDTNEIPYRSVAIFSAHGVAPSRVCGGSIARPAGHRRDMSIGHKGPPRSGTPRRSGIRHIPYWPTRSRRDRRHGGCRAVEDTRCRPVRARRLHQRARHFSRRVVVADDALIRRDRHDCAPAPCAPAEVARPAPARTSASPRRTGRKRLPRSPRECDLVLVVGSQHSHNSAMLARVAVQQGAASAFLVDGPDALDVRWLTRAQPSVLNRGRLGPPGSYFRRARVAFGPGIPQCRRGRGRP
jgi:4-hydroxy-3-methylbut-2-enyl diphosphate reductase